MVIDMGVMLNHYHYKGPGSSAILEPVTFSVDESH